MQIITAAGELFNHVDNNGPMWYGDGDREVRTVVKFSSAFQNIPHVILGLTGIDSSMAQNLRFSLLADSVSQQSFEIVMKTWDDTKIARAGISWSAIGQAVPKPTRRTAPVTKS